MKLMLLTKQWSADSDLAYQSSRSVTFLSLSHGTCIHYMHTTAPYAHVYKYTPTHADKYGFSYDTLTELHFLNIAATKRFLLFIS